jgi:RNA polymerase sigma factor (TIGR02999 family)
MSEVTRILAAIDQGDPGAAAQLLPLVYDELRQLAAQKLAHEKPGQTLQATALVHEAYLRLVDVKEAEQWNSRGHVFAAAAEAMRRIILNRARDKNRQKRGGGWKRQDLDNLDVADHATEADRNIRLCDGKTGEEILTLGYHPDMHLNDASFSASGHKIVTASMEDVRVWDATPLLK